MAVVASAAAAAGYMQHMAAQVHGIMMLEILAAGAERC
jgi:hypothetical protein